MDNKTPELIEAEMAETRQSLTEKVAALEDSVVGTVQSATTAVQDTVQSVRNAVEGTVDAVKENVASALDVRHHVRAQPWAMVGGAAVAGALAGFALSGQGPRPSRVAAAVSPVVTPPAYARAASPGVFDALLERIGDELKKLAESTIANASANLQRVVSEGLPKLMDRIVEFPDRDPEDRNAPSYPIGRWNGKMAMGGR